MSKMDSARLDELLDWLAEEVAARLQRAPHDPPAEAAPAPAPAAEPAPPPVAESATPAAPSSTAVDESEVAPEEALPPEPAPMPSHAALLLSRLAIGLLVALVLINIPLGAGGAALARMIPSSTSLIVRDGLLVQEAGKPDVYVYEGGQFRWVSDLQVFEHYGYRWENVHEVDEGFLASFEIGRPLYLVVKCPDSPHIYRLENGVKRWIADIPTFEAEGHRWEDLQIMSCRTLKAMPTGETIPPGRGPAPEPGL